MRICWVAVILSFFWGGCANFSEKGGGASLAASPDKLTRWDLEGRIGLRSSGDSWQANLHWSHEARQDRLRLSGPFNQGLVSIVVQDDLILINEGEGVSHLAHDPDAYLRERLGFVVPLKSLRFWILGAPDPSQPVSLLSSVEESSGGFDQGAWKVRSRESQFVGGYKVPGRLEIEGQGIRLKIIIDQWKPT